MKVYKITYACYESGCGGHEEYFLYKRNAEKCYKEIKKYIDPKLEEIAVKGTLNFEMEEVGSGKEISYVDEGKEAVLNKILKRNKKAEKKKKNLTRIIGPEELKKIETVTGRLPYPILYEGCGPYAEPDNRYIDGKELAQMIAEYLNQK